MSNFNRLIILYSALACCLATILYALHTNKIIVRWSSSVPVTSTTADSYKKNVLLFFNKRRQLNHEEKELLWSTDMQKSLEYLITSWLTILFEEEIVKKRVTLQSVIITDSQLYISFDRSPLYKENAVYDKLLIMQSLLKTLQENGITVQKVQFLVHHQPLRDTHLDFSKPWPASGYIQENC